MPPANPAPDRRWSCSNGWDSGCAGHRSSKPDGATEWSAARPEQIAEELNGLLRDPEVRATVAHDGGRTVLGHLDLIDVEAITADPEPILGHSDIPLLHLALHARTGLVGFHTYLAPPASAGTGSPRPQRAERCSRGSARGC
ncbi:LD-carboxypeptidase [Streptomyces sp. NPDC015184]|uniref:LD-carboxypeptidase n=1 Tax=Streptomyces sp. NPDC015184 TaxID=3364946 RepID=UPI0036F80705